MYKELEKYKTHNKIPTVYSVTNSQDEITINLDEYKASLGDLINDFIDHKTKPFWRRTYYHNHLTKLYLKMLNQVSVIQNF